MKIRLSSLKKGIFKKRSKDNDDIINGAHGRSARAPFNNISTRTARTLPTSNSFRSDTSTPPELSDTSSITCTEAISSHFDAASPSPACTTCTSTTSAQPATNTDTDTGTIILTSLHVPPPPRRSSLKTTSSYSSDAAAMRVQRHHSMSHVMSTSTDHIVAEGTRRGKVSRSASMPLVTKNNVSFDQTVSFVAVPRLSDICPQYPESLFYKKTDFTAMQDLVRKDADTINRKKAKPFKKTKTSLLSAVQDNELCDVGIEHRTCTPKERFDREAKARAAIVSVLREQGRHRRHHRRHSSSAAADNRDDMELALAKASMDATKEATIRARERAAHVKRHCLGTNLSRRNSVPPATSSWISYF